MGANDEWGKYGALCRFCLDDRLNTSLSFYIVDVELNCRVPERMVNYCPFCGRKLEESE